jgi:hypothetical protein
MRLPRLLLLSLPIALCVATAAAQSSPAKPAASPQLLPATPQNAQPGTDLFQFQLTSDTDNQGLSPVPRVIDSKNDSLVVRPLDSSAQHLLTLEQDEATCYTIRAYRVARVSPDSDTTKPAGYSTCQRASRFQFKTAVDSREIAPR